MIKSIADFAVWVFLVVISVMSLFFALERQDMLRDCAKAHGTECHLVAMPTKTADRVTP